MDRFVAIRPAIQRLLFIARQENKKKYIYIYSEYRHGEYLSRMPNESNDFIVKKKVLD